MHKDTLLDAALASIQLSVRAVQPYHVGGPRDIAIKLNQNESASDVPGSLKMELASFVATDAFHRYPLEWPESLTEALAVHTGWPGKGILIGNGSNDLMYTVAAVTIVPGTRVVLPRPLFSLYEKIVRLGSGDLTTVAPQQDLSIDVSSLMAAIRLHSPALVAIATPNNPTGLALRRRDVIRIAEVTRGLVLVDEAYVEFSDIPSMLQVLDRYPNVLLLRTFSKAYGLAGLRVGYLIGSPALIGEIRKARYPFAVDRISETAALMQLQRHGSIMKEVVETKRETMRLYDAIVALEGITVLRPQANFVVFRPLQDSREIMCSLMRRGVLVRDLGGYPEMRGYLRVSTGTKSENNIFLAQLESVLHETDKVASAVGMQ